MNDTHHKKCFGRMLPNLAQMRANQPLSGPVFRVGYASYGIGVQGHSVDVDIAGWDLCRECPEFESCYALSLARFQVEHAVAEATGS